MTLRAVAGLVLILGIAALLGFLQIVGKAPWSPPTMRHLRAMKDRTAAPDGYAPFTIADFESLPHGLPLDAYARLERRAVSFDGYVQHLITSMDGDFHLELAPTPRAPGGPDTAYVTAELTPQWRGDSDRWSFEGLAAALRPNRGGAGAWDAGPRRARVSGWLLYDFPCDSRVPPGATRYLGAVSGWEIHPITRIELWDDSTSAWRELSP